MEESNNQDVRLRTSMLAAWHSAHTEAELRTRGL